MQQEQVVGSQQGPGSVPPYLGLLSSSETALCSSPSPKYQCQNIERKLSNVRSTSVPLLHNTSGYLNSLQTKLSAICCFRQPDTGKNQVGKVLQMDCDLIEVSEDTAFWTLNRCNSNYILRADTLMSETQKLFSSLWCPCSWVRLHLFGKGNMCQWLKYRGEML